MSSSATDTRNITPITTFVGVARLFTSLYIVVLSGFTLFFAVSRLSIGHIIGSVHIFPVSLCLFGLELEIIQLWKLGDEMYQAKTIGLQFLAAVLVGINQNDEALFFISCVAFGAAVSIAHFSGVYGLLRKVGAGFENKVGEEQVKRAAIKRD